MKKCGKCDAVLVKSIDRSQKKGYRYRCAKCKVLYDAEYRKNNSIKIQKRQKKYVQDNSKEITSYRKQYYKKNRERILQQTHARYEINREDILKKQREWRVNNKEKKKLIDRRYRTKNADKISIRSREYYEKNRKAILEKSKEYYMTDKDKKKKYDRGYRKFRQKNDPGYSRKATESAKRWRQKNPLKQRMVKLRRRKREKTGAITDVQVIERLKQQGGLCLYCKVNISEDFTVDHRIPLSREGTNVIDNIDMVCMDCNRQKNNKTKEEYLKYLNEINYG